MEALSVAASAVQLAAYSASIITFIGKLFKSLRNLPQQYHQYEVQLLLLIHITFNIENNPALQTKDIKVHLEATTKEVAALQSLLCRPKIAFARSSVVRRLWDTIEGFEQQVSSRLERLRQMTIVLQISLESENTRQVYCIRQGVNRLNTLFAISGVGDQGAARAMDNSDTGFQLVSDAGSMQDSAMLLVERVESMQASGTLNMESHDVIPAATNSRTRKSSRKVKHRFGRTTMGPKCTVVQGNIHNGKGSGADVEYIFRDGSLYGPTKLGHDSRIIQGDLGVPEGDCVTGHDYEENEYEELSRLVKGDIPISGVDFLDKFMGWGADQENVGQKIKVELNTGDCRK